ncbi:MAG: hypothetical protein ACW967_03985 [Candidatus Hodarchaeales archaeon]
MDEFLRSVELQWRQSLKQVYPLYWKIPLEWNLEKDIKSLWSVEANSKKMTFQLIMNKRKIQKELRKLFKFIPQHNDNFFEDHFQYLLFHHFFHIIEAPFSDIGEFNDNELIHKAIWDGIITAEPDLSKYEVLEKVSLSHSIVKDFIIDNRLYLENLEFNWFTNDILLAPYYNYLIKYKSRKINFFLIISFINVILYGSKGLIQYLEHNFLPEVSRIADKVLIRLLGSHQSILISGEKELGNKIVPRLIKTNRMQFVKKIRNVFQGDSRYSSIKTIVSILGPTIDETLETISKHSSVSFAGILTDVFDQFSSEEQTSFVREILDKKQLIPKFNIIDGVSLKLRALHEYYLRNNPEVEIKGDLGIERTVYHPENSVIRLKKAQITHGSSTNHFDLARIDAFQKTYGIPMLISLEDDLFLLNEYELRYKKRQNIKYKIRSGDKLQVPDVLELYLDKTGSMFLEKDKNNQGWNDGSRYDNSVSVLYGFITALDDEAKRQHKTCYVRFHSFSETQVSSPLLSLGEFLEGDQSTLKVIFNPENGYDYENLNLELFNDGLKRVYVIITDGDLVIEGRTEREAKKMQQIAKNPLNKLVLFEMEQQFSLGLAVQHNPQIISHSVKNKESMFQQGISIILKS